MVAKKKVGRPAKKKPAAKKTAVKRGRPRKAEKKEAVSAASEMAFHWDRIKQQWTREITVQDLSKLVAKLSTRVTAIEVKIDQAEQAGAKIQRDLEQWRKHSAPKWKPRQPSDGKPAISHADVKVMLRNGETLGPHSTDAFSWGEIGDRTIIAYAVV